MAILRGEISRGVTIHVDEAEAEAEAVADDLDRRHEEGVHSELVRDLGVAPGVVGRRWLRAVGAVRAPAGGIGPIGRGR